MEPNDCPVSALPCRSPMRRAKDRNPPCLAVGICHHKRPLCARDRPGRTVSVAY